MQRPDQTLIDLRPLVPTEIEKASEIEQFQNEVLRPILKFQHDLFVAESRSNQILNRCFQKETIEGKRTEIKHVFSKNAHVKYLMIGMVTGLMTAEEFQKYQLHKSEYDKRLSNMLIERIMDGRR
jgi:hypothetical protein